jgi:precorrin-6A/cobalt-precorrin-6A reductase
MKVLLLAGSGEGRVLADALYKIGVNAVASLAGATRQAKPLALPTRIGGFGGEDGFCEYLAREKITHILDATHPFASRISHRTALVSAQKGLKYMQYLRPAWTAQSGDQWHHIRDETDVLALLNKTPSTVFLATGRQTLERFANLEGHRVICRQIDSPTSPFPFEGGEYCIGRPPFSVGREVELFEALRVDLLVVKNAGGTASRSKLDAAALLGLPVAMIERPPQPDAPKVDTIEAALDWVRAC